MANEKVVLEVEGMTCNHCASTVSGIIDQEGGRDVHVDFLMGEAAFELSNPSKLKRIQQRIQKAGYQSSLEHEEMTSLKGLSVKQKFLLSLPFSLLLFSHMFVPMNWWINNPLVQVALCTPVFLIGLTHFGKSVIESFKVGSSTMDLLILIGSSSAFIYSLYGVIFISGVAQHDYLFFETTSTIITLVLLGYVIEKRAVDKTTEELKKLYAAKPEKAKKLVQEGLNQRVEVVPTSHLQVGDLVLVNLGDKIPSDGILKHGESYLDESMLTGESTPVLKKAGDEVLSGSLLTNGNATVELTSIPKESTISKIIQLVKESRSERPAIQRIADKMSAVFVPTILFLATAAFLINYFFLEQGSANAMLRSIAVLVIACPCAMGLATPTAVSVGLGIAARFGIVLKRASSFEALAKVKYVALDKTGTLTQGVFQIEPTWHSNEIEETVVLGIINSLEQVSNHPLSTSFVEWTKGNSEKIEAINEIKGRGVRGTWKGMDVQFGSKSMSNHKESGDLFLTIDGKLIVSFVLKDQPKPFAKAFIDGLKKGGFIPVILSGDQKHKASSLASELGISNSKGELMPEDKLKELAKLRSSGSVAMIGDGINDAPALSAADVGISIGTKNALASQAASIAVLSQNLMNLSRLFKVSQAVVKTIKQNLFWAVAYNIVAIPLAAFGYLDPMLAALSMAFSDVIVIGNSLRLRLILRQSIH